MLKKAKLRGLNISFFFFLPFLFSPHLPIGSAGGGVLKALPEIIFYGGLMSTGR